MTEPFAVLLDIDGTLVDSNYFHTLAWHRALRSIGATVTMSDIHRGMGMGADQLLEHLLGPGDHGDEAEARWHREFVPLMAEIQPTPGGRDLIRVLAERGAINVYATSGQADDVGKLRRIIDADHWIHDAVNASEVEASKPAPDIFRLAMQRSGVAADRTIVVGDTVWDVRAAAAAGLRCIALTCGGISRGELVESGAVAVYDSPQDLLDQYTSSPLNEW
jgi:HAD superfamily hydrolase (TIGR01549 family)